METVTAVDGVSTRGAQGLKQELMNEVQQAERSSEGGYGRQGRRVEAPRSDWATFHTS